ncbi:amidohydrolase [Persicimonas caeni]|uniref:Amidohydrolase n=1 Tax=Persicimonas caeni TaxID=2292766 RepID=A0A4Y6PUF9_PERCE|nr:amidohydrolase family protein [Persicimonas caeni]QDG51984.1 amidohydrolase [Persicimonas caeni]QED33205.1 amidohydrolase [Persicimonas caeni]
MIIDIHVHLVALREDNGCYVSDKMSRGIVYQLLSRVLGLKGVSRGELDEAYRDRLLGWAHDSDLDGVGVLALDGVYDDDGEFDRERTQVYVCNDYCLKVCEASAKLLPICSVNPKRKDAIEELERVVAHGAVAIKMLPNSQGFDPGDPDYQPFWQRMVELGVPLLIHSSFEHTIPPIDQSFGRPERLHAALSEGVTVISAHCASAGVAHIHEDIGTWQSMLREFPNLFGDISAMASMARFPYLKTVLADEVARERVALGSDFPIPVSPWLFLPQLGFQKVRELNKIDNPLQKNLETFKAMGVDNGILRRGERLLKL